MSAVGDARKRAHPETDPHNDGWRDPIGRIRDLEATIARLHQAAAEQERLAEHSWAGKGFHHAYAADTINAALNGDLA